jgi:hypothetical protein
MAKRSLLLLLTLALLTNILHADDSVAPLLGKWKLDPSHSRLTDQMKVESAGPNRYNLIFSGDNVETVTADGTDQPALFGSTFSITVQDANHIPGRDKPDIMVFNRE